MEKFDVVVIGAGVGGMACASSLNSAGKKVAIVENNLWGGTCPNRGCDPKKVLYAGVEAQERVRQLAGHGFSEVPTVAWTPLQLFKRTFTDPVSESRKKALAAAGITVISGPAKFLDQHQLEINTEIIYGEVIVIATGQRPNVLPIPGQELLHTSTDFLSLTELPRHLTFLGAGYIAFELVNIAVACGAQVTIIHHNSQPLKGFDEKLAKELVAQMAKRGIEFIWDEEVTALSEENQQITITTASGHSYQSDYVVAATGRKPNCDQLALEKAGVHFSPKGVQVNEYLQTNVTHIYACGDVLAKSQPKLTPVAIFEGNFVAQKILGKREPIDYPVIPTIVYGTLKLAKVGQTKADPSKGEREQELNLTNWFTYHRVNEPKALIKLVVDQAGSLLGATSLSGQADELINYLGLCIQQKIHHEEITKMIIGYPTVASDLEYLI